MKYEYERITLNVNVLLYDVVFFKIVVNEQIIILSAEQVLETISMLWQHTWWWEKKKGVVPSVKEREKERKVETVEAST